MSRLSNEDVVLDLSMASMPNTIDIATDSYQSANSGAATNNSHRNILSQATSDNTLLETDGLQRPLPTYRVVPEANTNDINNEIVDVKENEGVTQAENSEEPNPDGGEPQPIMMPMMLYLDAKYAVSIPHITAPGFYSAIWRTILSPNFTQGPITINVTIIQADGKRIHAAGSWDIPNKNEAEPENTSAQESKHFLLRLDKKIWVQEGYRIETDIQWPIVVTKDPGFYDDPRDPSVAASDLSFEMRPYDPNDELSIPVKVRACAEIHLAIDLPIEQNNTRRNVESSLSKDEKTLVTLGRNEKDLTLNFWDLSNISPNHSGLPVASTNFKIEDERDQLLFRTFVPAVSYDGQFAAVAEDPGFDFDNGRFKKGGFPVRIFQRVAGSASRNQTGFVAEKSVLVSTKTFNQDSLVELPYDSSLPLSTFLGFVKFQYRTPGASQPVDPKDTILLACNGNHLDVYELLPKVNLLYSVSMAPLFRPVNLRKSVELFMANLQDSLTYWHPDSVDELAVWNWRTGSCVGVFPVKGEAIISEDESVLVIVEKNRTAAFSIQDGTLKSSTNHGSSETGYSFEASQVKNRLIGLYYLSPSGECIIRNVNVHDLMDSFETKVQIFDHTNPRYFLSNPLVSGSVGAMIAFDVSQITFIDIETGLSKAKIVDPACGPDCINDYSFDPVYTEVCHDQSKYSYHFAPMTEDDGIVRLVRTNSEAGSKEETLVEFPSRAMDDQRHFFLDCKTRFVVWRDEVEIWRLPTITDPHCRLLTIIHRGYSETQCRHNKLWAYEMAEGGKLLMLDLAADSYLSALDTISFISVIERYNSKWKDFTPTYRQAVLDFTMLHINRDPGFDGRISWEHLNKEKTTVMWEIVLDCLKTGNDSFLCAVLEQDHTGFWVPQESEFSADASKDMIAYLISEYKFSVAQVLIDYCLARAHSTDPKFLDRLMVSVPHMLEKHSDAALEIARRAAFIRPRTTEFLLQQTVINGVPWRWKFWKKAKVHLYQVIDKNPVFQRLDHLTIKNSSDRLQAPEYVDHTRVQEKNADIKANLFMVPFSLVWTVPRDGFLVNRKDHLAPSTPFVLKVIRMLWHFMYPLDHVFVQTHYDDPDVFENPAIVALMGYKWARVARYFWGVRMVFQIAYELLVLGVTFFQIYASQEQQNDLTGCYIAIIALGYALLHLEFQQMRSGFGQYFSSPYNYVDLSAYAIPMISACCLLANPFNVDALRALSFAVVLIYLHFIFELRVYKNVCKVVTIVVNILLEIPAFFVILAIFILSFAHSINHLTEVNYRSTGCSPNDDGSVPICQTLRDEFPTSYLKTVAATYFFMTGDYGPVGTSITDGHWTSQIMVGLFFFLTAVLMMNVVIALMNGAYADAVVISEKTWLRNRLDLIASAENLTYFLPGFRDGLEYFPKYVYYTATDKEIEEFQEKFGFDKNLLQFDFSKKKSLVYDDPVESVDELEEKSTEPEEAAANGVTTVGGLTNKNDAQTLKKIDDLQEALRESEERVLAMVESLRVLLLAQAQRG